jgi:hypothetical protein
VTKNQFNPLKIWRPGVFQGAGQHAPYFEGWFFKLVDAARQHVLAVIPGIHLAPDSAESHAFIQILDGKTHQSSYRRFPLDCFQADSKRLALQIGANYFSEDSLQLNLAGDGREIRGQVEFKNLTPWPVRLFAPGIMGWYAFVPFMECYHGVLSFDHPLSGTLQIDGIPVNFDGGRGYLEKDWGKSFPGAYVWLQSNHFEKTGISLMVSVAQIPWLSGAFRGFLAGLLFDGTLYRFTTYSGAKLDDLEITDSQVRLAFSDKTHCLKIQATRPDGAVLHAPYAHQMLRRVSETLAATVAVEFYEIKKGQARSVFKGTGQPAGLDVNGRLAEIVGRKR